MILMPKSGKLLIAKGKIAQCIAQAIDTVTPIASQFILNKDIEQM